MYAEIRILHVALMLLSIGGFILRWSALRAGAAWPRARWVRITPHVVDSCLLASGLYLASHWGAAAWQGWLGAKMAGLLVYILAGAVALRAARGQVRRYGRSALGIALLAVLWMVSAALTKSALGPLAWLGD